MVPNYKPPVLDEDDLSQTFVFRDLSNIDPGNAANADINLNDFNLVNVTSIGGNSINETRLTADFVGLHAGDAFNFNNGGGIPFDIGGAGTVFFANSDSVVNAYAAFISSDVFDGGADVQSANMNLATGANIRTNSPNQTGDLSIFTGSVTHPGSTGRVGDIYLRTNDNLGSGNGGNIFIQALVPSGGGARGNLDIATNSTIFNWGGDTLTISNPFVGAVNIDSSSSMAFNIGGGGQFAFNMNGSGNVAFYGSNGVTATFENNVVGVFEMNLSSGELRFNSVIRAAQLGADPAPGNGGEIYYNSVTGKFRGYNAVAAAWQDLN